MPSISRIALPNGSEYDIKGSASNFIVTLTDKDPADNVLTWGIIWGIRFTSMNQYVADKTTQEIYEALENGMQVVAIYSTSNSEKICYYASDYSHDGTSYKVVFWSTNISGHYNDIRTVEFIYSGGVERIIGYNGIGLEIPINVEDWSSETTTVNQIAYYTYEISGLKFLMDQPIIGISAAGLLPTADEQEAYDTWQYAVTNVSNGTLTLYSEEVPANDFSIYAMGVY